VTAAHYVAGVARLALAKDGLAGRELARDGDLRDPPEIGLLERRERRYAPEQLDDVRCTCCPHEQGDTTPP